MAALALQIPEPASAFDQNGKRAGYLATPEAIARARKLEGTKAPAFSLVGGDGKAVDSKSLFKKPTLLVFIEPGCPCCDGGAVYFSRLKKLYPKAANVVGLVYGLPVTAMSWKKANQTAFRVYADPGGKIAKPYRAEVGLALRLIDAKGKIVMSMPGYSASVLKQVASHFDKVGKQNAKNLMTHPAPEAMAMGCPLGSHAAG